MKTQNISFLNTDGITLSGRLDLPLDAHPYAFALFAHCFTCNKNFKAVRQISNALTDLGIGVLSFDFTGLGRSHGEFSETNFTSNVRDMLSAAAWLEAHFEAAEIVIGHSLGGAAALYAAQQLASVRAVATIGSPATVEHVQHLFSSEMAKIEQEGMAEVVIGGRRFEIRDQLLEDLRAQDLPQIVQNLNKALLILHSPQDRVVPIENAAQLYHQARHPKSFVTLDGSDHILRRKEDGQYAGSVIASWAARYVTSKTSTDDLVTDSQVAVRLHQEDMFTATVQAGRHQFTADEPVSIGGEDFGPSPYQLLLSSLGACTVMTLHMYARRKKWPLEEVVAHLDYARRHEEDFQHIEEAERYLHHFKLRLEISGDLDSIQQKRLLAIAQKCPVHKTLKGRIEIETTLMT